MNSPANEPQEAVAIIGMAGRFPKAKNLEEFWRNLRDGVECVSFFKDEDAVQWLPIEHKPDPKDPRYVRARAVLEKPEWFDAAFFGMNPSEAKIMDPQHRVFLECAWEALENAGCNPDAFPGLIGVFAGASMNSYLFTNLLTNPNLIADHGVFSTMIANDGDFVPTRASYKLNLRGPSINVQTACSTSLVSVCLAAQSLLSYRCDVALAGGVSITFPSNRGQFHLEGGILSNDGHCRAFDAKALGTVLGDGCGIVVLKRLSEAIADGDNICAVIKGTAINNDGAVKIGYTAPSIDGQAEAIAMAHSEAGFDAKTVSYIEAHGTGTPLGDPIEIAGLTKAFGLGGERGQFCAIGSVKSNIGHLDIGAGVAGLIKTVLALQHEEIPPSLHFEAANPKIDFKNSPFFVNAKLRSWQRNGAPRRAGVSSFGIGGTNSHAALEEAPVLEATTPAQGAQLLLLSAKTATALDTATENLAAFLERKENANINLADVAYTLQVGRKTFAHRRAVIAATVAEAVTALRAKDSKRTATGHSEVEGAQVAFMFTGQGAQSVGMAQDLYETDATFRATVDRACELLKGKLGTDLRGILFAKTDAETAAKQLNETRLTQPALFVIEYALAQWWQARGVTPTAMIGHSLGEYVAATLAGVFSFEDALTLVAERARLMQAQPTGAMLAVRKSEAEIRPFLDNTLALAAVNAPGLCVVSGPFDAVDALERKLAASAITSKRLTTSHAFHSAMMEGALRPLADVIRRMKLNAPQRPFVSNLTGTWITAEQATSADYWTQHLRNTVRFADGVAALVRSGSQVLLEVGPGSTLAGLARQHSATSGGAAMVAASLGRTKDLGTDRAALLLALGELWIGGAKIEWRTVLHTDAVRRIVALPTYPFERKRYVIEPGVGLSTTVDVSANNATASLANGAATVASANGDAAPAQGASTVLAQLRTLFQDLSGIDLAAASAEQSFYELGFDSLFLTQASLAVQRKFGVPVTFRQLRENLTTLAKLAAHLEAQAPALAKPASPVVAAASPQTIAAPAEKRLPLTAAQREMWFASQLGAGASAAYNEATMLRLNGALDVASLQRALRQLAARHEALRTTFSTNGEEQIIAPTTNFELATSEIDEAQLHAWQEAEMKRPFDLTKGPLLRLTLVRTAPQQYVLAVVVHHIVSDGWSLGVLVRELAALYSAEVVQHPVALPAPASFSNYAAQLATASQSPAYAGAQAFWKAQFADGAPQLELPTDRPRPQQRTHEGGLVLHTLPADVSAAVEKLCNARQCTTFTALLATFNVLLHRLSGQDDLVVGVPSAAQVMDGQENLVGHFANLLPIRSRLDAETAFDQYLNRVKQSMTDALEHWRYPFGSILQDLNLARDASRVPLAPVVFNTISRRGGLNFTGLNAELISNPKKSVNFDLNFNFAITGDTITLGCYYSAELYDEATIARWIGHFETLLRALAAKPNARVHDLPLLCEAERRQMLIEWNNTAMPYERDANIAELFAAQVKRTPDAIAVVGEGERLTYAQLDLRAERLAQRLRAAGVGPDSLVGIYLNRTPNLLVGIFGVLKAGGAYVPLDPAYPKNRLDFIVEDTRMPWIVTEKSLLSSIPAASAEALVLDDESAGRPATPRSASPATVRTSADNLAYVIYTSGSTGRPKGVCLTQRCVVALVAWARQLYRADELAGVWFATSASFDISIFEIFCPLCLGGKIIVAENILQLGRHPATNEVTFLSGVPSAMAEVVRLGRVPASVRAVALAGEQFPNSLAEALAKLTHIERVFELYGPTETTVYSTGDLRPGGSQPSLGRPFPNERCYVLDRRLQPVPVGVAGELYIAGDKLARGYLNRPELTAEKFFVLPWMPEERVYRTGDGARYRADGTIEFTSRLDQQVKIRGFRVELGEVESALAAHPAVADNAVVVRPDASGNNRLLAYVVARQGATLAGLREHLQQRLPDYMVPSAITPMEKFPLTTNGKLDRAALPEPDFSATTAEAFTAPRSTSEELLADVWRDVLGLKQVSVNDNFFEVGGHSLLAMQVISRLQESLGIELTMRQFFTAPTVAGLAPIIEEALLASIKDGAEQTAEPVGAEAFSAKE